MQGSDDTIFSFSSKSCESPHFFTKMELYLSIFFVLVLCHENNASSASASNVFTVGLSIWPFQTHKSRQVAAETGDESLPLSGHLKETCGTILLSSLEPVWWEEECTVKYSPSTLPIPRTRPHAFL